MTAPGIIKKKSKSLWFTSATSTQMDELGVVHTGLYRCNLNDESGNIQNKCQHPQKVADGWQQNGRWHSGLPLYNLQFSSANANTYVYGRTYDKDHPSWEMVRAKRSNTVREEVQLHFQSYFRTTERFDFNDCNFKCCDPTKKHAYTMARPKSYVINDDNGNNSNVYIAWEGFYKDCGDSSQRRLQWTIGISKLNTSDANCVLSSTEDVDATANFVKCTEPVSIVYQNPQGRSATVSSGGLAVAQVEERRMFFMSVLHSAGIDEGDLKNEIWAFPEGGRYSSDPSQLQTLANTDVDPFFFDEVVEDGGTLRLHYNMTHNQNGKDGNSKGLPNHLCHTMFNQGIQCFPIGFEVQKQGIDGKTKTSSVSVIARDEPKTFLSSSQVQSFCKLGDAAARTSKHERFSRVTTVTTGMDVVWNDTDGTPGQVFFGCWGQEGGNGNFGSVDRHGNLVQTLHGAYPGGVIFLPTKLELDLEPPTSEASNNERRSFNFLGLGVMILLWLLFCLLIKALKSLVRITPTIVVYGKSFYDEEEQIQFKTSDVLEQNIHTSYLELSTVESSDP